MTSENTEFETASATELAPGAQPISAHEWSALFETFPGLPATVAPIAVAGQIGALTPAMKAATSAIKRSG